RVTSFLASLLAQLRKIGISEPELVRASPQTENFGDGEVVFRVGKLLMCFVRDRGQEFLDLGASVAPDKFYQFGDVEIAMGWKSMDQVLEKPDPERLDQILGEVSRHLKELDDAFSEERERFTRARVERAAQERGQAFTQRLGHLYD